MTQQVTKGAPLAPAGESGKANGTSMLSVGCKLPNGLICELGKVGDEEYQSVRLNGANSSNIVGGYGITPVSAAFWDAWVKKHQRLAFVSKRLVFAMTDRDSARDFAQEHAEVKSGFEALDPMKGMVDKDGKQLITPDVNHLQQGKRDTAQAMQRAAQPG